LGVGVGVGLGLRGRGCVDLDLDVDVDEKFDSTPTPPYTHRTTTPTPTPNPTSTSTAIWASRRGAVLLTSPTLLRCIHPNGRCGPFHPGPVLGVAKQIYCRISLWLRGPGTRVERQVAIVGTDPTIAVVRPGRERACRLWIGVWVPGSHRPLPSHPQPQHRRSCNQLPRHVRHPHCGRRR
jgi:hypothetical protein